MSEIWRPHVVAAAVVEQDGRFLLVEEETDDGVRLNQPAGHWEENETLVQAVVREALEETRYHFRPTALLGVYRWAHPRKPITYLRFAFVGDIIGEQTDAELDEGILRPVWMSVEEIRASRERHRSPLLLRCVEDYLAGQRHSLALLHHLHG